MAVVTGPGAKGVEKVGFRCAVALTFAEPVAPTVANFHRKLVYRYQGAIV
jgi:hypothetical protein